MDRLSKNGILVSLDDNKRRLVSLECLPARSRSAIVFLVLFNMVWSALAVFLVISRAPWFFKLLWPLSSIGMWGLAGWHAFHRRTALFGDDLLTITNDIGPWKWSKSYNYSQLNNAISNLHMQSASTRYYHVQIHDHQQRKFTVVDGITEFDVATSIARLVSEFVQQQSQESR